jgi:hypothetical protein
VAIIVVKDGQQLGPFTPEEVNSQLAGGMLEPSDLGWSEDYDTWTPLSDMTEIVTLDRQGTGETGRISVDGNAEADAAAPGLKTAGEEAAMTTGGGKWKWFAVSALVVAASLGVYQFVFGKGDLSSLCTVLVEVILPTKTAPAKVVPPHVQKYQNAATAAEKSKTPIDAINERLDLRGDFHFTRNVSGLRQSADDWFAKFSQEAAKTPEAKGVVDLLQSALNSGGINEVKAHGMSSFTVKTNLFRHTAMLYHPTNSTGRLWKELDNNGSGLDGLRLMPQDAMLAIHGRVRLGDLSKWLGELNNSLTDSKLLQDAWQTLKSEVPIEQLQQSWNGEAGLYLTLSSEKFRVSNAARTELGKPGLMLVLGVKDGQIEKILAQQLIEYQEPVRQVTVNKKNVQLKVYEKPEMTAELDKLDLIPSICLAGNYLVLSIAFDAAAGEAALNREASKTPAAGLMSGSKSWAELSNQNLSSIRVPAANLALFLSPVFRDELAKWQKLDFWKDIDPGLQKTLASLAGSKQDGGVLAFTQVLPDGVLFKSYVHGDDSGGSFQRVKQVARTMVADLVPQLAKFAYTHWSVLEMPSEIKPKPEPETEKPSNPGS